MIPTLLRNFDLQEFLTELSKEHHGINFYQILPMLTHSSTLEHSKKKEKSWLKMDSMINILLMRSNLTDSNNPTKWWSCSTYPSSLILLPREFNSNTTDGNSISWRWWISIKNHSTEKKIDYVIGTIKIMNSMKRWLILMERNRLRGRWL